MNSLARLLVFASLSGLALATSASASIDTDSDGIDDLAETNTGIYVSATNTGTNPNSADTDGDGVPDGLEVKEKTSPVDATKFNAFSKGMVSYYPFSGNAYDEGIAGHDGIVSGATLSPDRFGNADRSYFFNGSVANYISNVSSRPKIQDSFTLSFWFKASAADILQGEQASWTNYYFYDHFLIPPVQSGNGSGVGIQAGTNGITVIEHGNQFISPVLVYPQEFGNSWVQTVVVIDNNSAPDLWVNGRKVRTGLQSGRQKFTDPLNALGQAFHGSIDDLRIYNRALASTEVAALYSSEAPPQPQFQIIQGSYTWQQSKADAEARGGRLAVLNTQAKWNKIVNLLNERSEHPDLWIGLSKITNDGQWRWITGESVFDEFNLYGWGFNGLGNFGPADAGKIFGSAAAASDGRKVWAETWDDDNSYRGLSYVLEFPYKNLITTTPTHGAITGAGEYDPGTTATLTAVPDAGYAFTGWTGDASGTANPLTLTMDADKTVGATFAADLSDADADGLTAYDEVTIYLTDPTKLDSDNDGLTDAYELGIGRFSVISGTRTWAQAKAHAETQGGTLATFANQVEWNLAMQSIGTDALLDVGGLWIGATDEVVEGTWAWVTGEPFVFTLWETGQPDNSNNSDYAAVAGDLGGTSGKWYDYRATTSRDGYILESGYSTNPSDADSDDDSLLDGAERTAGSNPFNADTDSDTLTDAEEVNLTLTNPTRADSNSNGTNDAADDQDGDGVTNLAEIRTHGTNPVLADTDSDGISDGVELAMTQNFYKLVAGSFNQAQAAADAATKRGRLASLVDLATYTSVVGKARRTSQGYLWVGLSDAAAEGTWKWADGTTLNFNRWLSGQPDGGSAENFALIMENASTLADGAAAFVAAGYLYERTGLDPLNPDTDGDGLNDGAEQNTHSTNPFNDDSDSDGLLDGAEVLTHLSNPNKADTDDDGLPDRQEVETYLTNPAAKDSDSDGFDDLFEINTGFNPRLASSTPDAVSSIRTSVEFRFNAANGVSYRIEASTDLTNWASVEDSIIGTGGVVTRFYSIENQPKRYFRVRRN